MTGVLL